MTSKLGIWYIEKLCIFSIIKTLKILKASIRSTHSLLVSSDVRPNLCNLSSYDKLLSFIINHVALFCTCSNRSMSFFRYGRHACTQYATFGLTKDWYSFNIILLSLFANVLLIIPKVLLADFAAAIHWLLGFKVSLTITPKFFSSFSALINSSPKE